MIDNKAERIIEVRHLSKSFGDHEVLRDVDFSVRKGQVVSIIGSSGSGKSTLLRCMNLLEKPSGGEVLYHGKSIRSEGFNLQMYRAHVGMVFQQFNLFANMTVKDNIKLAPVTLKIMTDAEAEEKAKGHGKNPVDLFPLPLCVGLGDHF